jgi:hypothetical protein
MDHVEFDFYGDFTEPLINFFLKCNYDLKKKTTFGGTEFPPELFQVPKSLGGKERDYPEKSPKSKPLEQATQVKKVIKA